MRRLLPLATICLTLAAASLAPALELADVTLYAPFEGHAAPALATGEPGPLADSAADVTYVPGVIGQGIVCGQAGRDTPQYPMAGHLNERRGALSVWFKPVNWRAGDSQQHVIIQGGGRFLLYHYWESQAFSFYWMRGSTVLWGPGYMNVPATPDQWHHFVFSWGEGKCAAYLDGQKRAETIDMPADVPAWAEGEHFTLSPTDWTKDGKNATALDELMTFSRPLAPQEAASLYRHGAVALAAPQLRLPRLAAAPTVDGGTADAVWRSAAAVTDFVDGLFGNLEPRPLKARLGYSDPALHLALETAPGQTAESIEVWATGADSAPRNRFIMPPDGRLQHFQAAGDVPERAVTDTTAATAVTAGCYEFTLPWQSLGLTAVPAQLRLNFICRFSGRPGDLATWADVSRHPAGTADPGAYAECTLSPAGPAFALAGLGPLYHAQLALCGELRGAVTAPVQAEIRLQPSDLRELVDPQTSIRTWSGTQIKLDRSLPAKSPQLVAATNFSDTDLNSLQLRLTDAQGVIYAAQRPFVALPPVVATVHLFPSANRLEVRADTSNYRGAAPDRLSLQLELRNPSGQTVNRTSVPRLTGQRQVLTLPLAPLPVGDYVTRTTLLQDGKPLSTFEAPVRKIATGPWQNTRLGRDDTVPPPFAPVTVAGQSVSVCGRTYQWRDSLFPVQITSAGQDLLAGPIELLPVSAGTADTLPTGQPNTATVQILEHTPGRALVRCAGKLNGLPVEARHLIEFDGMCLTTLRITGQGKLPGLTFVMPLKPDQSTLYHHFLNAGSVRGETVRGRGVDLKGQGDFGFINTLWLGNEDRGVTWFAENPSGWRLQKGLSPLSVRARDKDTLLLARFANHESEIAQPLALTFGLIATPVQPLRDNWRFMRVQREWAYTWCGAGRFTQSNNDVTNVLPGWKQNLARELQRTPLFVPYQRPDWINTKTPEATYFRDEWESTPSYVAGSDDGSDNTHLSVCLASDWQDFLLHYLIEAYDENNMVGFYFDGALPQRCKNQAHGCGWVDADGQVQPTYPLLAYREFYKRLAIECARRGRPRLIWVHCSNCLEMPTLSCTSMTWDGEQFSTAASAARNYAALFTMPYFRAEFLGQPFGLPVQWLVEFFDKPGKQPIGTREIDTVLLFALVHGVADNALASNLAGKGNAEHLLRVLDAQDAFGVREPDARFLPYWNNGDYVHLDPRDDNLVCSIWSRPGKALLLFANATPEDQRVTARLNLDTLNLPGPLQATDLLGEGRHDLAGGLLTLDLPASQWRAIVLSAAP